MSISKLVDDHNTTGIALVSIRNRFLSLFKGLIRRKEQRENAN